MEELMEQSLMACDINYSFRINEVGVTTGDDTTGDDTTGDDTTGDDTTGDDTTGDDTTGDDTAAEQTVKRASIGVYNGTLKSSLKAQVENLSAKATVCTK